MEFAVMEIWVRRGRCPSQKSMRTAAQSGEPRAHFFISVFIQASNQLFYIRIVCSKMWLFI
jgi:hypothetical protein